MKKQYLALLFTSITFLIANQAMPQSTRHSIRQSLSPDFSLAQANTRYVCRHDDRDEIELFYRSQERLDLWFPKDFNNELNDVRALRRKWQQRFQNRRNKFGATAPETRRAKRRWKKLKQTARELLGCGRSLSVNVSTNACLELSSSFSQGEGDGTQEDELSYYAIINGIPCLAENSPVVELELIFSYTSGGCSATRLNSTTFLTAAHCVENSPTRIKIHSGFETVTASTYFMHPNYNPNAFRNLEAFDLAIIKTNTPLPGPTSAIIEGSVATGETTLIAGYGLDENNDAGTLKAASLEIAFVDNDTIATRYNRRHPQANTCNGDSGGPLYVNRLGEWVIAGVTSNGKKANCGLGDFSRYSNLSNLELQEFINSKL